MYRVALMISLFNEPYTLNNRVRFKPTFALVKDNLKANLERVIHYYRRNVNTVASNHLLVQLLQTLPIEGTSDLLELVERVEDYSGDISRVFQLTSPVHAGRSRYPGTFLGETGDEIIITTSESFSFAEVKNDWENVSPVRFLSHPHADFSMTLPNGRTPGPNRGPVVVLLNLPLLALQYRLWRDKELAQNPDFPQTTMHFVANTVIPNALSSYMDVVYFNVFSSAFQGIASPEVDDNHPFYFNSYHDEAVYGIRSSVKTIMEQKASFAEALEMVSPITAKSLQEVIAIPAFPKTRQVLPALITARLPVIALLVRWATLLDNRNNRTAINQVNRSLRQLRSMNFSQYGSNKMADVVNSRIEGDIRTFL